MEQLKEEVHELDGLTFINAMKGEDGLTVYSGYINQEGMRHGLGQDKIANGDVYEGEYVNDLP